MKNNKAFRVKFIEGDSKKPVEAIVKVAEPSEFPGLVCFRNFIFKDQQKKILLPEEDAAVKRFKNTHALHIPYHNILYVEEIEREVVDHKSLPFLKPLEPNNSENEKSLKD